MGINRNNKIQILYSDQTGVTPDASQLEYGELAINIADGALYFRDSNNQLGTVSGSGSGSGFVGITAQNDGGSDESVNAQNDRITINTGTGLVKSVNGSVLTINANLAGDGKLGVASFPAADFSGENGNISLQDTVVKGVTVGSVIGGSGTTIVPSDHFFSILSGSGITCYKSGSDDSVIVIESRAADITDANVWIFDSTAINNSSSVGGGRTSISDSTWPSAGTEFEIYLSKYDGANNDVTDVIESLVEGDSISYYDVDDPSGDFLSCVTRAPAIGSVWSYDAANEVYTVYVTTDISFGSGTNTNLRNKDYFAFKKRSSSFMSGQSSFLRTTTGELVQPYGFTGNAPSNQGEIFIQSSIPYNKIQIHKSNELGGDNRILFSGFSNLTNNTLTLTSRPGQKGLTGAYAEYKLGPSNYNGTYYSFDILDSVTGGDVFASGDLVLLDIKRGYIENYVESFNGQTGAVQGVSSVNGRTGDLDVYTGYTAQADTPSSANTGDFWLETDTGDLFFYDGSSFIQISGADGPTGPTGPVGDYVETFNGLTGTVDTSSLTLHVAGISSDGGITAAGEVNLLDNDLKRANLKDFSEDVNAIGTVTSNTAINFENGNVQTVTVGGNCEFSFSNPPASGKAGTVTLVITNGGAHTTTFAAPVKWPGNVAPSLSSSGIDILSFLTTDGGTNIYGFVGGINFS